jgi:hypothetical protein
MDKEKTNDNAPVVLQNGIIVAGHPRSGTSLTCRLIESAGVHFPSDIESDSYNKDGYFEISIAKELEKNLIDHAMTEENIIEMNKVVRLLNDTKGLTGLKIVHIPSLFFYRHIAKNLRVVFIFRNPADAKSSMLRRGISQFKLSWFDNNNALIAAHENIPKSIVLSYESLMDGNPGIKNAFKKLGFNVDTNVIKKDHRTQKNSKMIVTEDEKRLYNYLKKLEKQSMK